MLFERNGGFSHDIFGSLLVSDSKKYCLVTDLQAIRTESSGCAYATAWHTTVERKRLLPRRKIPPTIASFPRYLVLQASVGAHPPRRPKEGGISIVILSCLARSSLLRLSLRMGNVKGDRWGQDTTANCVGKRSRRSALNAQDAPGKPPVGIIGNGERDPDCDCCILVAGFILRRMFCRRGELSLIFHCLFLNVQEALIASHSSAVILWIFNKTFAFKSV